MFEFPTDMSTFIETSYSITLGVLGSFLVASLWRRFSARRALKRSMMDTES